MLVKVTDHASSQYLQPLLEPRSIALIGASKRANSFGRAMLEMALAGGFQGDIFPVNPKYEILSSVECYPNLNALPVVVEHVVLGIANERVEDCLFEAIEHGAKAVTIFADCYGTTLPSRIKAIAKESGILICGPNTMGFHNLNCGLRVTPFPAPTDLVQGGISMILQSGSVMGALAHNDQRLRFNLLVSSGSEFVVSAADYLNWALEQPTTRVVGLFLESVRNPAEFLNALERARRRNIPVVMLKVGRTAVSQRMAASHTGAIVGHHGVFEAVMNEAGVHLANNMDEMAASLQLFSQGRNAAAGGVASIHDSGGERELFADLASDIKLPLATLSEQTVAKIAPNLEPGLTAENPLDAWGSGSGAETTFQNALQAMMEDETVALGLYVLDWRDHYYLHEMHERILINTAKTTDKPIAAVSNYAMTHDQALARRLTEEGIPLLKGTRESLVAAKHLLNKRDYQPASQAQHQPHPDLANIRHKFKQQERIGEASGFSLLSAYGISTPAHMTVGDQGAAVIAAEQLGYPVVLKTANTDIAHKTEVNGVKLNLKNATKVKQAYMDLAERLGPDVLVCKMHKGETEWVIGVINDRDFGPAVMIAPGGVMVELLDERIILMAPFDAATVAMKLHQLRATRMLTGYRGRKSLAFDSLCGAAARISQLAVDFQDQIEELDINPVLVSEQQVVAVDVLIQK